MEILEALKMLDLENDALWTGDGLPRVEVVGEMIGRMDVSRQEITDAAPLFTRTAPTFPDAEPSAGVTSDQPPVPPADVTPEEPSPEVVLAEANAEAAAAAQKKHEAELRMNAALAEKEKNQPPHHIRNQTTIQAFLRSQHEQRKVRAESRRVALAALGGLDIDARAPVDRKAQVK